MKRGFVRKSGAVDAEFVFLRLKSLGMVDFESMIPRDLGNVMISICYS